MQAELPVDVLILGGGMAGLTAGARAARGGASVLLLERGPGLGGSALLSNGYLWTVPDIDSFLREDPGGDVELAAALIERFPRVVEWVRSLGADISAEHPVLGIGRGHRIDIATYLRRCEAVITAAEGWILTAAHATGLRHDESGVVGARAVDSEGVEIEVRATTTVIATGGIQGDSTLLAEHLGSTAAEGLIHRSNPYSNGGGYRLAREAGAMSTLGTGGFYGHLIASPLKRFEPDDFLRMATLFSDRGVLLNEQGDRFTQEHRGDHHNAQAVAGQPGARALLVIDAETHEAATSAPAIPGMEQLDVVADATAAGARVALLEDLDMLGSYATAWGFDGAAATRTAHLADGPLRRAPYVAMEVRPAITFGYGGIRIDRRARVLDSDGTPIAGLRAAGADVGGLFDRGYAGGLAPAAAFALIAVDDVVPAQQD